MLKPVIVQNLDLLRQIRAWSGDAAPTTPDLARALERDPDNTRKSLLKLAEEGVVARLEGSAFGLTPMGDQLLQDLARDLGGAGAAAAEGITGLLWDQVFPDPDNARRDWDSDEAKAALAELADSIAERGLLQNLIVRPGVGGDLGYGLVDANGVRLPVYTLIGGERRWRAIGELIKAGRWDREKPLACRIRSGDAREAALDALAENLKRRDLKPLEEARAFRKLVDEHGVKTAEIAGALNCSQRVIQQRLQLLELNETDQARLDRGELKLEDARKILADRPTPLQPAERLLFAELAHASGWSIQHEQTWQAKAVPVDGPAAQADPVFQALNNGNLAHVGRDYTDQLWRLRVHWQADRHRFELDGMKAEPEAFITRLRAEVLGEAAAVQLHVDGRYATAWMNGPFELDDEGRKVLEERAARNDAWAQQREREAAEAEERRAKATRAVESARSLSERLNRVRYSPVDDSLVSTLAEARAPLPWRLSEDGIVDANGEDVFSGRSVAEALDTLIVAVMNASAGLQTPPPLVQTDLEDAAGDAFDPDAADDLEAELAQA